MRQARVPVLVAILVLLALGGVADRSPRPSGPAPTRLSTGAVMPTAAPADATSSTWYCAGATATAGSPAAGTVVLANTGPRRARGTVSVFTSQGSTRAAPVTIGPHSVVRVNLVQLAPSPFASAMVEVDTGGVVAELEVAGPRYHDVTPCASAVSDSWHFADGSTARDAALSLSLFNPFPDDAIADLAFSTDEGRAAPSDFEGIVVPARSLVVKNIGDHVRRREAVATQVSVRRGRLVAAQTLTRSAGGRAGLSLMLGTPSPGKVWYFPSGRVDAGVVERYTITNPRPVEARALVEVNLDEGAAEPFELTIPPHGRVPLVLSEEPRIPKGVGYSTTVRVIDDVPVVVCRTIESSPPASRTGRADTHGARVAAERWAFAAGGATSGAEEWLVVHNVGTAPVTVSFIGLAGRELPLEGLQGITVAAGRRHVVRLADHSTTSPLPVVVRSSGPVVAERALYAGEAGGISSTIGIPLG